MPVQNIKLKGTSVKTLAGTTIGFFVGFAAVSLFNVTAIKFKVPMHLNPESFGLLVSMPLLSGSLLRIPFSAWVDKNGGRKSNLILLALAILGLLCVFITSALYFPGHVTPAMYPWLLFLGLLSGCGIATFSPGISQTAFWFPKARQGLALGIFGGLGNLAPGIFVLLMPLALSHLGLTGTYEIWLALLVTGTILYALLAKNAWYFQLLAGGADGQSAHRLAAENGQELFPLGNARRSLALAASRWQTWGLVFLYFTTFGGFLAITVWLPNFFHAYYGKPIPEAAQIGGLASILACIVRVGSGVLADKIGGKTVSYIALVILAAGSIVAALAAGFAVSVVGIMLIATGMGMNNAAVFKLVPLAVPEAIGSAAGLVGGIGAVGGFLLPPLWGQIVGISGKAGYPHGMFVFTVLALLGLCFAALLRRRSSEMTVVTVTKDLANAPA